MLCVFTINPNITMEETNPNVETLHATSLQTTEKVRKKRSLWKSWKRLKGRTKFYLIVLHLFALVGAGILGAWAFYELGFTNNNGGTDKNNRYLSEKQQYISAVDSANSQEAALNGYRSLSVLRQFYPKNAGESCVQSKSYAHHKSIYRSGYAKQT